MSRRPLIAFLAQLPVYPPPLVGSMIRITRLVRELNEQFDIAFVCPADVETKDLVEHWDMGKRLARVVAVPLAKGPPGQDAWWGSTLSCLKAAIVTSVPGQRPRIFDVAWSGQMVDATRLFLREFDVKAVWATRTWTAEIARAAGAKRIIVDVDDFQGALLQKELDESPWYKRKPLHRIQVKNLIRYERRLLDRYHSVAICKEEDAAFLDVSTTERIHLVPNGVDIPETVARTRVRPHELLFVGTLSWPPNSQAIRQLVAEILPAVQAEVPTATLNVAGRGPAEELRSLLTRPDVELHESPLSLTDYYSRAAIAVAPLERGGGTSIKVLEGLAYGLPTVATPTAARGLALEHGRQLLIASSPREFAAACIRLLNNPSEAQALGEAGRREVLRRFSWQASGARAREAVDRLISSP